MLKQAILYEDELKKKYKTAVCDDYFKFYNSSSYRDFYLKIEDNDFWIIQRVSIDTQNNVIGFMSVHINRDSKVVNSFGIMNFTKQPNVIFAKDLLQFLRELRDIHQATKFEFLAYEGGHPEAMYRKFINKHGGHIVGTLHNTTKLLDGKYYNSTMFEIMRDEMNF